jgi:hypothetical protein
MKSTVTETHTEPATAGAKLRRSRGHLLAKWVPVAAAAVSAVVLVGPPGTAIAAARDTHPTTHQLSFVAIQTDKSNPTSSGSFYEADVDVRSATNSSPSATVGQDVVSCVASPSSARCSFAFAGTGGILEGHYDVSFSTGKLSGAVTGGTGTYTGASGTIAAKPSLSGLAVVVTYSS